MAFIVDKQTLSDLKVFNKPQSDSIFGLFNKMKTSGAAKILEDMFRYPLSDEKKIRSRLSLLRFFMEHDAELRYSFESEWFDSVEHYLADTDERSRLKSYTNTMRARFNRAIGADTGYALIHKAVLSSARIFASARTLADDLSGAPEPLLREREQILTALDSPVLEGVEKESHSRHLPYPKVAVLDDRLRYKGFTEFRALLDSLYRIEVYRTVAGVALECGFALPEILSGGEEELFIENLRHPLLPYAVTNNVSITSRRRIIFLTGANMAGKSTFMKSFGTALFLAHIGFPVPATALRFKVSSGLFTTINLPDNMQAGLSHFYAEVKRLRRVAERLRRTGHLVVIFDELFRGTNVKDAREGTVEVLRAFAERKDSILLISTHIIEAGEDLEDLKDRIAFLYFPTIMGEDGKPTYTYKLREGITGDRHGMMIVNNEKIIEILNHRV